MAHRLLLVSLGVVGAGGGWLLAYTTQRCSVFSHSAAASRCYINLLGWTVSSTTGMIALAVSGCIVGLVAGWGFRRLSARRHS